MSTQPQKISNGVKKILLATSLGIFGTTALAFPAVAATNISFTPANISIRKGGNVVLAVEINPQGTKNYTAKLELRYPPDLLEVKSFTFGKGWVALSEAGYDLIDNTNGILIKTAGYPGGVSTRTNFGTVSFFAKKSGSGAITLNNTSFALDAANQNVLSETGSVLTTIKVLEITSKQTLATPPSPAPKPEEKLVTKQDEEPVIAEEEVSVSQSITSSPLLAQINSLAVIGKGSSISFIVVVTLIIAAYITYTWVKKKRNKKIGK